jgi:DNA replication licensing factor MCM4
MDARPSSDAEDGPTTLSYVWGTNINVPDVTNAIARFLQNYRTSPEDMEAKYIQLIEQATEREEDTLNIDASNVYEHDPDLYSKIVRYPLDIIPLLDVACLEEAVKIKPDYEKAIEVCDLSVSLPVSSTVSTLGYSDAKSNVRKILTVNCTNIQLQLSFSALVLYAIDLLRPITSS